MSAAHRPSRVLRRGRASLAPSDAARLSPPRDTFGTHRAALPSWAQQHPPLHRCPALLEDLYAAHGSSARTALTELQAHVDFSSSTITVGVPVCSDKLYGGGKDWLPSVGAVGAGSGGERRDGSVGQGAGQVQQSQNL